MQPFSLRAGLNGVRVAPVEVNLTLPLTNSRFFVEDCAKGWLFLIATFPPGEEPLVHGFGITPEQAWRFARGAAASEGKTLHADATICRRVPAEEMVWESKSGQRVTLEHLQSIERN